MPICSELRRHPLKNVMERARFFGVGAFRRCSVGLVAERWMKACRCNFLSFEASVVTKVVLAKFNK